MSQLTERQERFCRERLIQPTAKAAAIAAGYKPSDAEPCASKLLRNPRIAERIASLQCERAGRLEVRADDVLRRLDEIARAQVGKKKGLRYEHVLKANELLGKHLALFTERQVHSFEGVTDEQLEAKRAELVARWTSESKP